MPTLNDYLNQFTPQYTTRNTIRPGDEGFSFVNPNIQYDPATGQYYESSFDYQGANSAAQNAFNQQQNAASQQAGMKTVSQDALNWAKNYDISGLSGTTTELNFTDSAGKLWMPELEGIPQGAAAGMGSKSLADYVTGWRSPNSQLNTDNRLDHNVYDSFDKAGVYGGSRDASPTSSADMLAMFIAAVATMGMALPAMTAAGAAGEVGAGGAALGAAEGVGSGAFLGEGVASGIGAWDAAAGLGGAAGAGAGAGAAAAGSGGGGLGTGSGAFLGEGVASGIPAWDAAAGLGGAAPAAGAGAGASSGGGGLGTGNGAFLGEGVASGVPAWDAAAGLGAAAPAAGAGGSGGGSAATSGTPPPANPYNAGSYLSAENLANLAKSGGASSFLGPAASLIGGLLGSQGQNAESSSTRAMDPRMDALFYGDLAPRAQGLLGDQMPKAYAAGNQLLSQGSALLGQQAPTTATNPYLKGITDDMQRRTLQTLGENNLAIQGNSVGAGGLGGSRQGVAQGVAAGRALDSLQGNIAGLYGNAYQGDQNRLRQDWTIGSGMLSQGLSAPWAPIQQTSQAYSPFTGFGTTTNNTSSGGGAQGAIGGALGAAQFGSNMGWW